MDARVRLCFVSCNSFSAKVLPHGDSSCVVRRRQAGGRAERSPLRANVRAREYAGKHGSYLAETFTEANQRSQLSHVDRVTWVANDPTATAVGYAIVRRGTAGKGVLFLHPAEIERIYLDRRWHGEGVGTALMDLCIAQAARWGCDGVWLDVWQKNPRAIAFYQRVGFTIVAETNFTLGTDVQADWVMARPIVFTTPR